MLIWLIWAAVGYCNISLMSIKTIFKQEGCFDQINAVVELRHWHWDQVLRSHAKEEKSMGIRAPGPPSKQPWHQPGILIRVSPAHSFLLPEPTAAARVFASLRPHRNGNGHDEQHVISHVIHRMQARCVNKTYRKNNTKTKSRVYPSDETECFVLMSEVQRSSRPGWG